MSQLLQVFTRANGVVDVVDATIAPTGFDQGLPLAVNALAIDTVSAIDHHHQGLPFTANSRIAANVDGVVDSVQSGTMPIDSNGRLVFGTGAVDHVATGIPFTATDQIAI